MVIYFTFVSALVFKKSLLDKQSLATGAVVVGDPVSGLGFNEFIVFEPIWESKWAAGKNRKLHGFTYHHLTSIKNSYGLSAMCYHKSCDYQGWP